MAKREKSGKNKLVGDSLPEKPKKEVRVATSLGGLLKDLEKRKIEEERAALAKPKAEKSVPNKPAPNKDAKAPPNRPATPKALPSAANLVAQPSSALSGAERIAFLNAFSGVKPLEGKTKLIAAVRSSVQAAPASASFDSEARKRLSRLVSEEIQFDVHVDADGYVEGLRRTEAPHILAQLSRKTFSPEARLDLHRMRSEEAEQAIQRFVREQAMQKRTRLLIVHGKGLHSANADDDAQPRAVLRELAHQTLSSGICASFVLAFASAPLSLGGNGALLVMLKNNLR